MWAKPNRNALKGYFEGNKLNGYFLGKAQKGKPKRLFKPQRYLKKDKDGSQKVIPF